jgi:hypothetical protein
MTKIVLRATARLLSLWLYFDRVLRLRMGSWGVGDADEVNGQQYKFPDNRFTVVHLQELVGE